MEVSAIHVHTMQVTDLERQSHAHTEQFPPLRGVPIALFNALCDKGALLRYLAFNCFMFIFILPN